MIDLVVDSSVVLKWIRTEGEEHVEQANALLHMFEAGRIRFTAPPLLQLELVNVAARKWGWPEEGLVELLERVGGLRFELVEPPLPGVARWTAAGLSAYDAAYVALAEAAEVELVTADRGIVAGAPGIARLLADVEQLG